MVRTNGFDRPFHVLQVFTWFLFPGILFGYYGVVYHLIVERWLRRGSLLLYSSLAFITFVCAWITSAVDPRDPRASERRRSSELNSQRTLSCSAGCCERFAFDPVRRDEEDEDTIVCYLCEARVEASSKHCRFCDKCVVRFDHHCKWLNTCIGRRNYGYFLGVIASTWIFSLLQLGLTAYYLCQLTIPTAQPAGIVARANDHFLLSRRLLVAVLILYGAVLLPLVALVGQLGAFHVMLVGEGLTTYEYILNEQRRDVPPPRRVVDREKRQPRDWRPPSSKGRRDDDGDGTEAASDGSDDAHVDHVVDRRTADPDDPVIHAINGDDDTRL